MAKAQIYHVLAAVSILLSEGASRTFLGFSMPGKTVSIPLRVFKSQPFFYGVDAQVGANQTFTLLVDTGSPMLAVAASPAFKAFGAPYYDGDCNGPSVSYKYGGGSAWKGRACSGVDFHLGGDNVGSAGGTPLFAGIQEAQPNSSSPTHSSKIRYGMFQFVGPEVQGILGMSFPSQAKYTDSIYYAAYLEWLIKPAPLYPELTLGAENSRLFTPVFNLIADTMDLAPIFSIQSCTTLSKFPGTMVLGGVNHSLHEGEIKYTPITCEGFYTVNVTRLGVTVYAQGKAETIWQNISYPSAEIYTPPKDLWPNISAAAYEYFKLQDSAFYVDSGQPYLGLGIGGKIVRDTINLAAKGLGLRTVIFPSLELKEGKMPACVKPEHLKHFPELLMELSGDVVLRVPPSKYMQPQLDSECLWPFILFSEDMPLRVLGNPVLETYYTVYDQVNKRMGFAPVAGCK